MPRKTVKEIFKGKKVDPLDIITQVMLRRHRSSISQLARITGYNESTIGKHLNAQDRFEVFQKVGYEKYWRLTEEFNNEMEES